MIGVLWRPRLFDVRVHMVAFITVVNVLMLPTRFALLSFATLAVIPLILRWRITPFEMALPVHGRDVLRVRLLASLLGVLSSFGLGLLFMTWLGLPAWPVAAVFNMLLFCVAVTWLPFALFGSAAVLTIRSIRVVTWVGAVICSAMMVYLAPTWFVTMLLSTAIGTLMYFAHVHAPPAFVETPVQKTVATGVAADIHVASGSTAARIGLAWRPVLRSMFSVPALVCLAFALLLGVANGLSAILLLGMQSFFDYTRARLLWLQPLPWPPRGRLLLHLVPAVFLPSIFVGLGGVAAHAIPDLRTIEINAPKVVKGRNAAASRSAVSFAYWTRVHRAADSVIAAPWGEQRPAYTVRVLGRVYANPYSSAEGSSDQFVQWQFARATTAVYGQPITRRVHDDNPRALPRRTTNSATMQILSLGCVMSALLMLYSLVEFGHTYWLTKRYGLRHLRYGTAMIPLITLMVFELTNRQLPGSAIRSIVERSLYQLTLRVPMHALVATVAAAVPVVALFFVTDMISRRAEQGRWMLMPNRG